MDTPEQCVKCGCRSGVIVFKFEQISHIVRVFPLLTLNM